MNEENIVSLSLNYYDRQQRKHAEYYKDDCRVELHNNGNDVNLPTYTMFKDSAEIHSGIYNILGLYFKEEKQWTWGWAINNKTKVETYLSRKILNYALDITILDKSNAEMLKVVIKSDLLNASNVIEHPVQLEQYLAIGQYVTNADMVYKIDNHPEFGNNVVVYALLKYTDL